MGTDIFAERLGRLETAYRQRVAGAARQRKSEEDAQDEFVLRFNEAAENTVCLAFEDLERRFEETPGVAVYWKGTKRESTTRAVSLRIGTDDHCAMLAYVAKPERRRVTVHEGVFPSEDSEVLRKLDGVRRGKSAAVATVDLEALSEEDALARATRLLEEVLN